MEVHQTKFRSADGTIYIYSPNKKTLRNCTVSKLLLVNSQLYLTEKGQNGLQVMRARQPEDLSQISLPTPGAAKCATQSTKETSSLSLLRSVHLVVDKNEL